MIRVDHPYNTVLRIFRRGCKDYVVVLPSGQPVAISARLHVVLAYVAAYTLV